MKTLLEPIRAKYDLPALAACAIVNGAIVAPAVVGLRKYGDPAAPVTPKDQFHLGSDTKAITATLIGQLVERGKLRWTTPLAASLPHLAKAMRPQYRPVTVEQLLAHRGGLPGESAPPGKTLLDVHRLPGPPRQQRDAYVALMLRDAPPAAPPGTKYVYSNAGYVLLGAIAEHATNTTWETLCRERIFRPLGMTSAGFGAPGANTPGKVTQPWPHSFRPGGPLQPITPGPLADNPPALGPAGTVHCSPGDWAKFVADQLAGARGKSGKLLSAATYRRLHAPAFDGNYAGGWMVTARPWAGGRALTHAGSNTLNFALVWLAPARNFAALVATNCGGEAAFRACDETVGALIGRYLAPPA